VSREVGQVSDLDHLDYGLDSRDVHDHGTLEHMYEMAENSNRVGQPIQPTDNRPGPMTSNKFGFNFFTSCF
jgi:hypothetical protein